MKKNGQTTNLGLRMGAVTPAPTVPGRQRRGCRPWLCSVLVAPLWSRERNCLQNQRLSPRGNPRPGGRAACHGQCEGFFGLRDQGDKKGRLANRRCARASREPANAPAWQWGRHWCSSRRTNPEPEGRFGHHCACSARPEQCSSPTLRTGPVAVRIMWL